MKYLQRYTLLAATGLEAGNEDNDGQGDPPMEALQMHLDRITAAENTTMLQRAYNDAYKAAVASKNTQAMLAIVKCKDAKRTNLTRRSQRHDAPPLRMRLWHGHKDMQENRVRQRPC